jgi:sugar phosphate isomerase/epimerase
VSTSLFHGQRLGREHLRAIGAAQFTVVQLAATRSHFDYHHESATADLQQWLAEAGLTLASVHAPVSERFSANRYEEPLWLASADAGVRAQALDETTRALHIARRLPFQTLVVHIGSPRQADPAARSSRDGARRSLEALHQAAAPLGVRLAVEVQQNDLSEPGALVHFLTDVLDIAEVGICLDVGHAHIAGDVIDAIETVSEHLAAVELHDNRRRGDDHLVPFEGTIDWPGAITTLQKVGYDAPFVFELAGRGDPAGALTRARQARRQIERLLAD